MGSDRLIVGLSLCKRLNCSHARLSDPPAHLRVAVCVATDAARKKHSEHGTTFRMHARSYVRHAKLWVRDERGQHSWAGSKEEARLVTEDQPCLLKFHEVHCNL